MPIDPTEIRAIGRYRVVRFIAEGGFAWVFEVLDPSLGSHRALKMLKRFDSEADVERFRREATELARLNDPCIVQIFDIGEDEGTGCPYFTMTLAEGPTLAERLEHDYGLSLDEVRCIFDCVLSGLAHLHAAGIVHRDVKPTNILLTRDSRALISDLGVARTVSSDLTATGVVVGTALYMSPEQANALRVEAPSDVFSLGLCLYQALEGRNAYGAIADLDATSAEAVRVYVGSLIRQEQNLPLEFSEATPPPLRRVIERACRTDPDERYPDAASMLQEFREAMAESLQHLAPQEVAWPRVVAAAVVLSALVVGGWWAFSGQRGGSVPALAPNAAPATVLQPAPPQTAVAGPRTAEEPLTVSLESPRGSRPRFAPHETLQVSVRPSRSAYLYCFYRDAGNRIFRIFPNASQPKAFVEGGTTIEIPDADAEFEIQLDVPGSREEVFCLAAGRDVEGKLPAELRADELTPLRVESTDGVIEAFRAIEPAGLVVARMPILVSSN